MQATPTTVTQYLRPLPADRRRTLQAIRTVILENIDGPFAEGIQGGSISYHVPHSVFPAGYHCNPEQPLPFAGIALQKHHVGLYAVLRLQRPDTGGVVPGGVARDRQATGHGQVVRAVQGARRCPA
jgi:hypothetical protein